EVGPEDLQRHLALQRDLLGEPDLTHPPLAEAAQQPEVLQDAPAQVRGGGLRIGAARRGGGLAGVAVVHERGSGGGGRRALTAPWYGGLSRGSNRGYPCPRRGARPP